MPVVKGGVWTNIEDEILKASISKYGLNQWARVSSLLARKTPKQCKARWGEWLDPGIRKIEWSKEEDEKLLHLAKLMPTQWRTIAPIVGRTATQCLERYQKLLDEAESKESQELGLAGPEGGESAAPSADDVRRLRPGELDPDPESKPARPDTIDLDEDEKEMLSEARARLANTQGKKAKRKARERQLEESRRLALLQKRRELKNAGINIKIVNRKKGQMDYNADIPFEKKAVPGFYDTQEEADRNEKQREAFDPKKVANKRKGDQEDGSDTKRRKGEKTGQSASFAAAAKAGQLQSIREAEQSSKRRSLMLPAPQVGESELEKIVKMGMIGDEANRLAGQSDNAATRGFITPVATPFRGQTPRRPPTTINEEASRGKTGNAATPFWKGETPSRATDLTPLDNNIRRRKEIFSSLPKPKAVQWELEMDGAPTEYSDSIQPSEEDATEIDKRDALIREANERAEFRRRTQVSQRGLPRPVVLDIDALIAVASAVHDPTEKAIAQEMALLVAADAERYVVPGSKLRGTLSSLELFDDAQLDEARRRLALEVVAGGPPPCQEEWDRAWEEIHENSKLPGLSCYDDDEIDEYQMMAEAFENIQGSIMDKAQKGQTIEKKLKLHLGGYQQRAITLRQKINEAGEALEKAKISLDTFRTLQVLEEGAIPRRLNALREEVTFVSRREREAQEIYRARKEELEGLVATGANGVH